MRIIEHIDDVGIEVNGIDELPGITHVKKMLIPKRIMIRLQAGITADERVEVVDEFDETIYIYAPEIAVQGGICPGPCPGPTLIVETTEGSRLMIELDRAELEMLETIDLTNMP